MAVAPGTRLGPYEILAPLGAGGMGEVWRARDTKLDREAALKFLPASFADDPERLARFEREAKVLASLNHTNIASIYGLHEHDGLRFLAMELVPGVDLAERLKKGSVPFSDAIDMARQLAEGLEVAHEQGIVHRDLKPANIKQTPEGKVKILDFGLAKALDPGAISGPGRDAANSPTITSLGTVAGVILGTAAYMSPEQARGRSVDKRADIWAFGCVLFEMLTGKIAFDGDTISDTMAAVLTRDPDWGALPAAVPPRVRELLARCLRKDPKERLRDIGDARIELRDDGGTFRQPAPVPTSSTPRWMPLVAALAVVAALAGATLFGRRSAHTQPPEFRPLTFGRGFVHSARFGSDGKTVIYGAAFEGRPLAMFTTRTDGFESRPIDLPSADIAGISKDGQLALLLGRHHDRSWLRVGTLAQVALSGGTPRELMENVYDADISPDGKQFAVVLQDGDDQVLQYPVGKEVARTHGWISQPRIAPDGQRVAFVDHRVWGDDLGEVKLLDAGGKVVLLGPEQQYVQGVCWSPDGSEAWFTVGDDTRGGTLFRVTPGSAPRLVLRAPALIRVQDVSADGHVLILTDDTWVTLAGRLAGDDSEHNYSWWANDSVAAIAGDGASYAGWTGSIVVNGEYGVFFRRGKSPPVQLTLGASVGFTPDGKYVLTRSVAGNPTSLTMVPVGAGTPRVLNLGGVAVRVSGGQQLSFSSDGARMAFVGAKPGEGRRAWVMDLSGGVPRTVSTEGANTAMISPEGSKVAVGDAKRGLFVVSGTGQKDLGAPKGDTPLGWSTDGCCVYSWDGTLPPRIFSTDVMSGERTFVRELVSSDNAGLSYGWVTLSPDGRFYMQRVRRIFSTVVLVGMN